MTTKILTPEQTAEAETGKVIDIQPLKTSLAEVMPILTSNLSAAYTEYMAGDIAAGAFGYVCGRHETACVVLQRDDIPAEKAYEACALLAIDLRSGIDEMDDKTAAQSKVDAWWQVYRDAGFTEVNSFFDAPMRPVH